MWWNHLLEPWLSRQSRVFQQKSISWFQDFDFCLFRSKQAEVTMKVDGQADLSIIKFEGWLLQVRGLFIVHLPISIEIGRSQHMNFWYRTSALYTFRVALYLGFWLLSISIEIGRSSHPKLNATGEVSFGTSCTNRLCQVDNWTIANCLAIFQYPQWRALCSPRNASQIAWHNWGGYSCAAVERFIPPSEPWITWCVWLPSQNLPCNASYNLLLLVRTDVLFLIGVFELTDLSPNWHWSKWAM